MRCPACGLEHESALVQSINARRSPDLKQRLLDGELNKLACSCGKRTQLEATVLYHDPDANYFCQSCPGGETAMVKGAEAFRASGASGTLRLVPSLNALLEKVRLLEAGLDDRAVEMIKVLLLASLGEQDINRVLLFEAIDRADEILRWVLFDDLGPHLLASPLTAYDKLAARLRAMPTTSEPRIDRAWAVESVRVMVDDAS